jgi:hypothetical protein
MSESDHSKQIVTHLEFLGYEVEDLKVETGHTFIAKNPSRSTLTVRMFNNVTILISRWGGFMAKAAKSRDFFDSINEINQQNMGKWYYETDSDGSITIVTEMDYYDYNKTTFGNLLNNMETEVQTNLAKFRKFLPDD